MATDYILFIHGVNTREQREEPSYADELFGLIQDESSRKPSHSELRKVALYWGNVNKEEEDKLLASYKASPYWNKFWFREMRETQILQFAGDAPLYISRYVGAETGGNKVSGEMGDEK